MVVRLPFYPSSILPICSLLVLPYPLKPNPSAGRRQALSTAGAAGPGRSPSRLARQRAAGAARCRAAGPARVPSRGRGRSAGGVGPARACLALEERLRGSATSLAWVRFALIWCDLLQFMVDERPAWLPGG